MQAHRRYEEKKKKEAIIKRGLEGKYHPDEMFGFEHDDEEDGGEDGDNLDVREDLRPAKQSDQAQKPAITGQNDQNNDSQLMNAAHSKKSQPCRKHMKHMAIKEKLNLFWRGQEIRIGPSEDDDQESDQDDLLSTDPADQADNYQLPT